MRLEFVKMHGLGNDFVVIDERRQHYQLSSAQHVQLADRHFGIGCDQILYLEAAHDQRADGRYRVVNADGSPAEHCGNGIRCVARYLERRGEARERVVIEIGSKVYELVLMADGQVRVDMGIPDFEPARIPLAIDPVCARYALKLGADPIEFGAVSMGNPHAAIEVDDVEQAPVAEVGAALQASPLFPASVNVGFMHFVSRQQIELRVFERGAGETLACGTGACAAMAIGRRWDRLDDLVEVRLRGGAVQIAWNGDPAQSLWMTGPATFVYEGIIEL